MIILGIHDGHNCGASLFKNGTLLIAISEERITRNKNEYGYPEKPKGNNGFGYDPIFIPKNKNKTFGEMKSSQKYKLDHRYKAFKKIKRFL